MPNAVERLVNGQRDTTVFQRLADAAEKDKGLTLHPENVKEIVVTLQAMQHQLGVDRGHLEALTRIGAVMANELGGAIDIPPFLFEEAENYALNVEWAEEGDMIHVTLENVGVPGVPMEDGAADLDEGRPEDTGVAPVPGDETELPEGDVEGPTDESTDE